MHTERLSGRKGGKWPEGDAEGSFRMEETGHFCVAWEGIVDGTKSLIWWQGWFRTWGGKDRKSHSELGEGGKWRRVIWVAGSRQGGL